jgi:fluoride exporter
MNLWLVVALGGAFGAVGRYALMQWITRATVSLGTIGHSLPWGTLAVNVLGSALIGVLYVLFTEKLAVSETVRGLWMVGLLGAFTTFSTFSLDTVLLIEQGQLVQAVAYTFMSVVLCVLMAWLGIALMRLLT